MKIGDATKNDEQQYWMGGFMRKGIEANSITPVSLHDNNWVLIETGQNWAEQASDQE